MSSLNTSVLIIFFILFISCNTDNIKITQQEKLIQELQDSLSKAKQKEDNIKYYQQSTKYAFCKIDYSYSVYTYQNEIHMDGNIPDRTTDIPARYVEKTVRMTYLSGVRTYSDYTEDAKFKLLDSVERELRESDAIKGGYYISENKEFPRNLKISERNVFEFDSYAKASEVLFAFKQ